MKYQVGDVVICKGEVFRINESNQDYPYGVAFDLDSISASEAMIIGKDVKEVSEESPFSKSVTNITHDLKTTLVAKNHDYGNSLHKQVQRDGIRDVVIRCEEKVDRLLTLTDKDHEVRVADESIYDTLRDLAGYAILGLHELNQTK